LRWHADYLFSRHPASLAWTLDVASTMLGQSPECLLAGALLSSEPRARRGPPRFGASDCVCAGHLLWFPSRAALRDAVALVARADVTRVAPLT
jgi:Uri superfamily endonuclease